MTPFQTSQDSHLTAVLQDGLAELSLPLSLADPLLRLCTLLEAWAGRMSLTAHRDAEAIARRLVLDALALADHLPTEGRSLVDLGSGAGFPGFPIAIARPELQVTLVEARERRHHFQRAVIRELRLENVRPLHGRSEELEATPHDLSVAQAMAEPARAVHWLAPWVAPGGWIAIPGSAERPPAPPALPDLEEPVVRSYQVPLGGPRRTVWLARRLDP